MANKGGWKFRKPRGSRACMVCRLRKVRCNAATQMPCSNCISFGADCRFPEPRKKAHNNQKSYSPQPITPPVGVTGHGDNLVPAQFVNGVDANTIPIGNSYHEVPQMAIAQAFPLPHAINNGSINQGHNQNHNQNHHSNNPNQNHNHQVVPQQVQHFSQMNEFQAQPQGPHSSQEVSVSLNQPCASNPNPQYAPPISNQGFVQLSNQPYTDQPNQQQGLPWVNHARNITVTVDGTSYIPNNPMANISIRNIMPRYNPSDMSTTSSNGVKVSKNRRLSRYLYFGPSSCYSYFVDYESTKKSQGDAGQDLTEKGFSVSSSIDPNEIITELQVLNIKGAFNLPSRPIMLNLFEAFFDNIYPLIPLINKDIFMQHFNDPNPDKQPPLILIQALLMAGSRSSQHPAIVDSNHDSASATYAFYQRVKSLYDSSVKFEYVGDNSDKDDGYLAFNYPTVLVQVSCLLSWHWVDPEDVSRGIYFWIRNAITIAQTFGFHKNMEEVYFVKHLLSRNDDNELLKFKIRQQVFYWKKIWWWLFCRDRSGSMSFGRPLAIDLYDISCDIPTIEDFEKYESDSWSIDNAEDKLLADYLIHSIYLSEIMGLVMQEQYSNKRMNIDSHISRSSKVFKQLNLLMGVFFNNLPEELKFTANDPKTMNVYSCLLGALYYVTLYHINRVKIITIQDNDTNNTYWGISFQAAYMTSLIAQYLGDRYSSGERLLLSPQLVYTMSMAMMILSFHLNSTNKIVSRTASKQMKVCLKFSRQCHAAWPGVTYLLITFFTESLISPDKRDVLIARAKSILLKICKDFMLDEEKGKSDLLKSLNSFDLNFLLNETDAPSVPDTSVNEDFAWGKDEEDLSLPVFNTITIKLPPLDSEFCKSFDATKLFPKRNADYNLSPTPSPTHSPEQAKGKSHSRPLHLQHNGDAVSAPRTSANANMPEPPLFHENYPNGFGANSITTTSTSALPAAASFGNENIPLYPTAPDPVYPSFTAQAQQSTSLDYDNNAVLDSQYFLNDNSGVNWNSYNM